MPGFEQGDKVRFTTAGLGSVDSLSAQVFNDYIPERGDTGIVHGPHPQESLKIEGWYMVVPDFNQECFVPVFKTMIEKVD